MRQLKHHEQKLLKKVDFMQWKSDAGMREIQVMRRYHVQNRCVPSLALFLGALTRPHAPSTDPHDAPLAHSEDYHTYNKICGQVRRLSHLVSRLPPADPFRTKYEDMLLSKLYDMGILDRGAKMSDIEGSDAPVVKGFKGKEKEVEGQGKKEGKVTVGAMCRRRLAVVMVRLKMAETVKMVRRRFPPSPSFSLLRRASLSALLSRTDSCDPSSSYRPSRTSSKGTCASGPTRSPTRPSS